MTSSVFDGLLLNLRAEGLSVGLSEWIAFLEGVKTGLAKNLDGVYHLGRALLVHSEAHYDLYDLAFSRTFAGLSASPELVRALERFLDDPAAFDAARAAGEHNFKSLEELLEAMRKTLEEQQERHEGGNRWVGTGGTSPYGTGGRANQGVQLGNNGGGRSGVRLAEERRWQNYRTDQVLEVRDFAIALRALRHLAREGEERLDIEETIDATAKNAGEIEIIQRRDRKNRVKVALFMDSGGSMYPHTDLVSRLFTAAKEAKGFKTFQHYYFHNCIYQHLWTDYEQGDRVQSGKVLEKLDPDHRLIFVGDASMAPWELFTKSMALGVPAPSGLDRFEMFKNKCEAAVWLNPDAKKFWDHPTVSAIGRVIPMYSLTLDGLRDAIKYLRAPR
ncbi:MAG: VWA containing CoxE family protein [Myxococcota bacterium]